MNRDTIIATLQDAKNALQARGVSHAALFGSVARGEDRPGSDIDILVEIEPAAELDMFAYAGIVHMIQDMFPSPVDVADRAALKSFVRPGAERDAIYAF